MGKGEAVEISLGTETIFIGKTMKVMVMIMGIIHNSLVPGEEIGLPAEECLE